MFSKQSPLSATNLSLWFTDPHISYPIHDLQLPFSDYITQSQIIIESYRPDLHLFKEEIVLANTPFEFCPEKPARYGALLIHGLFDSPYMMRDIGQRLYSEGLLVRSILLPGHGTVPGALLNIKYDDWLQATYYGISSFNGKVEKLYLVGFSMGGLLAYYHALQSLPLPLAGLILLAPAFQIRSGLVPLSGPLNRLGKIWPRLQWVEKRREDDYAKYHSVTMNAVHQIELLLKKLSPQKIIPYPQLLVSASSDKTINSTAICNYFTKQVNPENRMILYTPKQVSCNDSRIIIRNSHYPEKKILDISHIAIPISPSNTHYGNKGNYVLASRDDTHSMIIYDEVNQAEKLLYAFLYKLKLNKHLRYRLSYNPDFDFLMQTMKEFIGKQNNLA